MILDDQQLKQTALYSFFEKERANCHGIVFDIDGVLLQRGKPSKNADKLLKLLEENNIPYLLLTNDGSHSKPQKRDILQSAGLNIQENQIISCGDGLVFFAEREKVAGELFFIMGDSGIPCYAEKAGLIPTRKIDQLNQCKGVIVGEENYEWETMINRVINFFIEYPDAYLAVPNPDEYYPGKKLTIQVASGGIARFIQSVLKTYGIRITPHYLGKPYSPIFDMAHRRLEKQANRKLSKDRIWMVGDNLDADIKGALSFGYKGFLVLTGITHRKMLDQSMIKPHKVFDHL